MNRRIALSGLSIFASLLIVGGATFAAFSSSASNVGNTFGSGTLVLNIDGKDGSTSTPKFTITNTKPGDINAQAIVLSNSGSIAASSVKLTSISHSSTSTPDLGDKLTLALYNDPDGDGTADVGGDDILIKSAHITDPSWSNIDLGFGLSGSSSHHIVTKVTFDDADNTFQNTNSTFDLNFIANQ